MRNLYSKYIDGRLAELFLTDDSVAVVKYDGRVISESGGATCRNIEGIYDLYLQFCVMVYQSELDRQKEAAELYEIAESMGWNGIF